MRIKCFFCKGEGKVRRGNMPEHARLQCNVCNGTRVLELEVLQEEPTKPPLPAAEPWQPWYTAPKDGTTILAYFPDSKDTLNIFYDILTEEWCFYGFNEPCGHEFTRWARINFPEVEK